MGMIVSLTGANATDLEKWLERWSMTDESGMTADRLTLTVLGHELQSPPVQGGDKYGFSVGGEDRGVFEVSTIKLKLDPRKWIIQLSPAKFQRKDPTGWREKRKKTYKAATVKDVVNAVMSPHGYEVRVDKALADLPTPHLNQTEETDRAFLTRLAKDYDAVAKPVNNLFIFGKRGNIKKLSGSPRGRITLKRKDIVEGTAEIDFPSAEVYRGIKANWREAETGLNGQVVIGEPPFKLLDTQFKSSEDATKRAEAELKKGLRNSQTFNAGLHWRAGLFAEGIFTFDEEFKEETIKSDWSFDRVSMSGTRQSVAVQVTASRPDSE